ncbi:MAG: LacI family DNA-binding transcriptional regulator [Oscillospiraceae bacterium]
MRTTIRDIALRTGLSVSTVSLVLNHKEHRISEETCKRVFQAAKELNYRPNQAAVSLITKRTNTLGLIIPDITNVFFAEIAKGAQVRSQELGYSLILCNTNDDPEKDVDYVNVLLDRGVDGILLVTSVTSGKTSGEKCLEILKYTDKPVVLVDREIFPGTSNSELPGVFSDNELGGYMATKHLLSLGHTKLGCITGPMGAQSSKHRLFGHIRALQEAGLSFDPALVKEGNYHTESGFRLSGELLDIGVTGIFACNDMMAYGVCRKAAERGILIPTQLSVVGFDDLPFSEFVETPLTSIKQPAYEMGEAAVEKMIGILANPDLPCESTTFQPELVIRKSTVAPYMQKATN